MAVSDPAHDATDEEIRRLSKRLHAAYSRAYMEMAERAKADLERQAEADREMAARVKAGEMTAEQLASWRRGRAADATWYAQMVDQLARQMAECDRQAAAIVNGASPAVYAENANYGAFQVEEAAKVDTSWTLVDADTVATLVRDHPDLLPQVSPNPSKAEAWARRKVTSAIIQSVLVGESVPAAARRLRSVVDMGERAATRAARTALTGAENAGRVSSYDRARGMGIDVRARWMATLDSRTRDSHRQLDGEVAGDDGRFSNGLRYPGDPTGPASEVWNCRCTLVASVPGYDAFEDRNASKLETSYEDWKAGRDPKTATPSGRSLKEFMDTPAVGKAAGGPGMSKTRVRKAITDELKRQGRTGRDFPSMSRAEQQAVLRDVMERERHFKTAAARRDAERMAVVDMGKVNGKSYRRNVERVFGEDMAPLVHDDMRRMLRHRSGTLYEDIYAYDLDSGKRIGSTTNQRVTYGANMTAELKEGMRNARDAGHRIAIAHNHPGSSAPSAADIMSLRDNGASFGVIACHDGSIIKFSITGKPMGGYDVNEENVQYLIDNYDTDDKLFDAYKTRLGVSVERLA